MTLIIFQQYINDLQNKRNHATLHCGPKNAVTSFVE